MPCNAPCLPCNTPFPLATPCNTVLHHQSTSLQHACLATPSTLQYMLQLSASWFFCLQFNSTCSNTSGCMPMHSSNPSMWSPMLFGPSECYFSASIGEFCIFEPFLHILTLIGMFAVILCHLQCCVCTQCVCAVPTAIGLVCAAL